jgi:hypothetical protein
MSKFMETYLNHTGIGFIARPKAQYRQANTRICVVHTRDGCPPLLSLVALGHIHAGDEIVYVMSDAFDRM